MFSAQNKVHRFHTVMNAYTQNSPALPPLDIRDLRLNLIEEEFIELEDAFHTSNLPNVADAIGDLLYVVLGTAVACGINIDPIFEAIHISNMAKVGGKVREDGKILKPEGWQPPDIMSLLKQQGWKG